MGSVSPPASISANGMENDDHCAICLSPILDRTVIMSCSHSQFCFDCIKPWTNQSRRCPLCSGPIHHLIHNIRSERDYQTHHLFPLADSSDFASTSIAASRPRPVAPQPRYAMYGRTSNANDEANRRERQEERAIERRAYIYREKLFAKHIAANRYTGFKVITPESFANPQLKARVITFVRRELQVFPNVDIPFLITYLLSIATQIDLHSSSAVRLLSDFLDDDIAEHFAHEVLTFARSPFTTLEGYDRVAQYARPTTVATDSLVAPVAAESSTRRSSFGRRTRDSHAKSENGGPQPSGSRHDGRVDAGPRRRSNEGRKDRYEGRRRSDDRDSNRYRPRSRSRSHSRSHSPVASSRRHRLSAERGRSRTKSKSRSASPARSPPPAPALSPHNYDLASDLDATLADGTEVRPVHASLDSTATKSRLNISIFGTANKAISQHADSSTPTTDAIVDEIGPAQSLISSLVNSIPTSTSTTALRVKLQARLLDEYRSQAVKVSHRSTLRKKLQDRLRAEKVIARENEEYDDAEDDVEQRDDDFDDGPYAYPVQLRDLLYARLEEEKMRAEEEIHYVSTTLAEDQTKEDMLRSALERRKSSVVSTSTVVLPTLAEKLKEKLLREKLIGKREGRS